MVKWIIRPGTIIYSLAFSTQRTCIGPLSRQGGGVKLITYRGPILALTVTPEGQTLILFMSTQKQIPLDYNQWDLPPGKYGQGCRLGV